ncbi:hypothetical protein QNI19_16570 [Cytophagaceae bacterium DM2B3-1]|uniref:Transposase n=2 Tax=Xanthocytophaga TaxID=3078918 RepID=A0ABT7CLE1_9BACT|nr:MULTISPECIES: hypothetical protein [Xanthocytophaga]MDJ1494561.1 hypothetical protein [Xanthocytophaga flavus]MDJ1505023.1 hypothetical protein [Xanthocytophaga agilis]
MKKKIEYDPYNSSYMFVLHLNPVHQEHLSKPYEALKVPRFSKRKDWAESNDRDSVLEGLLYRHQQMFLENKVLFIEVHKRDNKTLVWENTPVIMSVYQDGIEVHSMLDVSQRVQDYYQKCLDSIKAGKLYEVKPKSNHAGKSYDKFLEGMLRSATQFRTVKDLQNFCREWVNSQRASQGQMEAFFRDYKNRWLIDNTVSNANQIQPS